MHGIPQKFRHRVSYLLTCAAVYLAIYVIFGNFYFINGEPWFSSTTPGVIALLLNNFETESMYSSQSLLHQRSVD
ncbi:hypothetical protein BDV93DRAFT_317336 [Ceratobasidium sp. AG-I]|nr:hypothetical protein BDV93DRAFT_317336 [Ceratobasidium sp. AG-I]